MLKIEENSNAADTVADILFCWLIAEASEISGTRETETEVKKAEGSKIKGIAMPVNSP